jgi:hypothetical protein
MGQVFLGVSPGGRRVAVKLIHPEHARTPQFRERFAREIEAARRVGGFHTAQVVDADPQADPPWMVTAFIEGMSLQDSVDSRGPLRPDVVCAVGAGLAEGLAAIHACGLVHRDLKPANVVLAADGPRIIDFGISRAIGATTGLTSTGVVVGTLTYMSPEQIRGDAVGPASDVFALGSVLAFAATGRAPFGDDSAATVMFRIFSEPPDLAGVADGRLRQVVSASLAKAPQDRPGLQEMMVALGGQVVAPVARTSAARTSAVRAADPPAPTRAAAPAAAGMPTQTQAPAPVPVPTVASGRGRVNARQRRMAAMISLPAALVVVAVVVGWLLTRSPHVTPPASGPRISATHDAALRDQQVPATAAHDASPGRQATNGTNGATALPTPDTPATGQPATPAGRPAPSRTVQAFPAGGSVFSHQFGTHSDPNYVLDVPNNGDTAGQSIVLFQATNSDPAEQWTVSSQGATANFFTAGLVSTEVAAHYGCIPKVNFTVCSGQTAVNDPAFEIEYAPGGMQSGECMGLASTAVQGEGVTLEPCGVSGRTVWIEDISGSSSTLSSGYIPLINGSDTNFAQPFVLTYPVSGFPTDMPRPQLQVDMITHQNFFGPVDDNQLWGA